MNCYSRISFAWISLIFRAARKWSIIDWNAIHTSRAKCSDKDRLWWDLSRQISLREHWFDLHCYFAVGHQFITMITNALSVMWLGKFAVLCKWTSVVRGSSVDQFRCCQIFCCCCELKCGHVPKTECDLICTSHSQLSIYVYRLVFGLILYTLCGMQGLDYAISKTKQQR